MTNFGRFISASFFAIASFTSAASVINFDASSLNSHGVNQDTYGDVSTTANSLTLTGDQWKSLDDSFSITSNTLLRFDIFSSFEGEIMGIGLDNKQGIDNNKTFKLAGTQDWGISDFDSYDIGSGWQSFSINVGDYYTGIFDRIFFVMDNDAGSSQSNVSFRDVKVCEPLQCDELKSVTAVPAPSTLGIMAFGLLIALRRKNVNKLISEN